MIPYSTDAPIYHYPIGTGILLLLNVVLFFGVPGDAIHPEGTASILNEDVFWDDDEAAPEAPSKPSMQLSLQIGNGLHPAQWIASPFLHTGFGELVMNLIGIWAFGLVVEGKIGWYRFLFLYTGIGICAAILVQLLWLFGSENYIAGAHASVAALLGLAVAWAPKNTFEVWFGWWFGSVEIPILIYGFIEFAFMFIAVSFGGLHSAGLGLQLFGLMGGIGLGILWIRKAWVDCEGWDLLAVLQGRHIQDVMTDEEAKIEREAQKLVRSSLASKDQKNVDDPKTDDGSPATPPAPTAAEPNEPSDKKRRRTRWRSKSDQPQEPAAPSADSQPQVSREEAARANAERDIEALLEQGQYETALKLMGKHQSAGNQLELPQPLLESLMTQILAAKEFEQAIPFMSEHIRRFSKGRVSVQLNLAKVLLHLERPTKAKQVLLSIDRDILSEQSQLQWRKLMHHAKKLIDDGVIELSD